MTCDYGLAVVDHPIASLDNATRKKIEGILSRAMRENGDEPESLIRAIRLYEEAAALGSAEAFVKLIEIGSEINSPLLGDIDLELAHVAASEKDRQYIKDRVDKETTDLQEDEIAMLLKVANYYGVLHLVLESMVSSIEEANEASDSEWMFSDGHDDG